MTSHAQTIDRLHHAIQHFNPSDPQNLQDFLALLRQTHRDLEGPGAYLSRVRFEPLNNMCQLMAIETGLIGAIVGSYPRPITTAELEEQTGQGHGFIARIMRLLAAHGVVDETDVETYRSNPICEKLNTPGEEGATRNMVELMFPIASKLVPQLRAPGGLSEFGDKPGNVTPFAAAYGGQSMFEFLETHAYHKAAFDQFMASRKAGVRKPWCEIVDLTRREMVDPQSVYVVDVAGGKGHDLLEFRRRFPGSPGRLVLQDLPETFVDLEGEEMEGVELMPHDMFLEQPVRGARYYVFSAVLHDWSDERCRRILERTATAMEPGYSRVLIHDMVLKDKGEGLRGASLDVAMLMMPGGKERTLSAIEKLLAEAGLRVVRLWPGVPGGESVVEAELVDGSAKSGS
ncbi:hypothetical protein PRZ48_005309 [Zasmidium cellare]|uniref:O-methyltransferase C-terminal domain-containing protein n=1 Tax=Zasmidium cellare TaxID=395010 RepID=A0ABR0ET90_ZASCE|nr:hypothetical protein PRZ48_005309 [Zasmidium cellare]